MKKRSKLLTFMLSLTFLLTSCGGADVAQSQAPESDAESSLSQVETVSSEPVSEEVSEVEEEAFIPVFRLLACSDTHISTASDDSARRLAKLFASAYKYGLLAELIG